MIRKKDTRENKRLIVAVLFRSVIAYAEKTRFDPRTDTPELPFSKQRPCLSRCYRRCIEGTESLGRTRYRSDRLSFLSSEFSDSVRFVALATEPRHASCITGWRTTNDGRWTMDDGQWTMDDGRRGGWARNSRDTWLEESCNDSRDERFILVRYRLVLDSFEMDDDGPRWNNRFTVIVLPNDRPIWKAETIANRVVSRFATE